MISNIQLEQSVLACMLISKDCSLDCNLLTIEDFTEPMHKGIFESIRTLIKENKTVDYLTVHNQLHQIVSIKDLADLSYSLPTTANFKQYVEELKDVTLKRKLFELANNMVNNNKSGKELAEYAEQEIFNLRQETSTSNFTVLKDIITEVHKDIIDIYDGKKENGLKTGFTALDTVVGGLKNKEYILLAARPSIGKTAFAINIASNLIMMNKTVAFFSYEMGKNKLVERMLKSKSLVSDKKLKKQGTDMEDKDWLKLVEASSGLYNRKLYIDDDPNKKVSDIASMCRKLKREQGLDLIVIDYLQKVKSSIRGEKRQQVEQVSNDLKNMAMLLDVPVIVISSLSRASEQRESKIPIMSDLRESGQIEFDADVIIFLHRDYYYNPQDESLKHDADIVVAKNRNDSIGRGKMMWFSEYTLFTNSHKGKELIDK